MKLKLHESHRVAEVRCLNCGSANDGVTGVSTPDHPGKRTPETGDIMLCFYCGHLMQWAEGGGFEELSDEAAHQVAGNPIVLKMQAAIAARKKGKI